MKLLRFSHTAMVICFVGLLMLAVGAVLSVKRLQDQQDEIARLIELDDQVDELAAAAEGLLLFGAGERAWQLFVAQSISVREGLAELGAMHPDARKAGRAVGDMVEVMDSVRDSMVSRARLGTGNDTGDGNLNLSARDRYVLQQVISHGMAVDNRLQTALREHQQLIAREANLIALSLALAALVFGLASLFALISLYRRLSGPVRELVATIQQLRSGNQEVRARVTTKDEFAELAASFNELVDQQQRTDTQLRQQQRALESQHRMLVDSQRAAAVASWRYSFRNRQRQWTDEMFRLIGFERRSGPLSLDQYIDRIHPEDRSVVRERAEMIGRGQNPGAFDCRFVRDDGQVRHLRNWVSFEHDARGNLSEIVGTVQDITRFLEYEDYLNQYQRLVEGSDELYIIIDGAYRFLLVNEAYARSYGLSRGDVEGRSLSDILQPGYFANVVKPAVDRSLRGETVEFESRRHFEGAGERHLLNRLYPVRSPHSGTVQVGAVITDISEIKSAEDALRESRDQLANSLALSRALIHSLPAHIALLDSKGVVTDINEEWRRFGLANGMTDPECGLGSNYLEICERASSGEAGVAADISAELRLLLNGDITSFTREYACHVPEQQYWFRLMATALAPTPDGEQGGAVIMHVDITERKEAEERARRLAFEDRLTGLLSRKGFLQTLRERLDTRGWQSEAILIYLDLKQFHDINAVFGFGGGDEVMRQVGERLSLNADSQTLIGRTGGDEFVIFAPAMGREPETIWQSTIAAIFASPFQVEDAQVSLEARAGFTRLNQQPRPVENLIREAELALFHGRERGSLEEWIPYTDHVEEEAGNRIRMTRDLRQALAAGQFELHFQPKVRLATGELSACEALVRWRHPQRGLISPGEFIPVAEQSMLIKPLGSWVLREACRLLREWMDADLDVVEVSVNVSLPQFLDNNFPDQVAQALATYSIEPHRLVLEITESVFRRESRLLREEMMRLRDMGVRLSLDDFGSGYSSLRYLQNYPFTEIKVDRWFVGELLDNDYSRSIVTSVLEIAGGLGADVVAEGIEGPETRDALLALGCEWGQGYFFSMPLAAEDFRWLLDKRQALPVGGS